MASIASASSRIKGQLDEHLSTDKIIDACRMVDHQWRDRQLGPATTLRLFVIQVLHGNVACRALRHLGAMTASPTAYCKARMRLPIDVFIALCAMLIESLRQTTDDFCRWRGHRVWMVDGTGVSMPDTESLQRTFGQPAGMKRGCGFPMAHVLLLMDMTTGFIGDLVVHRFGTHDASVVAQMHASLDVGDVLLGDRAFGSWGHFGLVLQQNLHLVAREHQRRKPPKHNNKRRRGKARKHNASTMRVIRTLGRDDQIVELDRPKKKPTWMSDDGWEQLPATITLRRIRYRVTQPGMRTTQVTLLTTLTDPRKYPAHELAELYQARWRIETNLRHLKTTMGMDVLRCKSPAGVMRELWTYVLVYNLVRSVMLDEARRRRVDPDRISFIDTLDALRHGTTDATLRLNPLRPGRHQPRVIKRRKDRYTYMTRPREQLRKALDTKQVAA